MKSFRVIPLVAGAVALASCKGEAKQEKPQAEEQAIVQKAVAAIDPAFLHAFGKLPARIDHASGPDAEERISLGRTLYYETRLSKNHDLSCNSCHDLAAFGVDGKATSPGHKGQLGARNSPTVYNAAGRHAQFWDGRAVDVEEQATGPIMNPVEMAMPDEKRVVETLRSIPAYVEAFAKAFPEEKEPITLANVGKAIGAFERGLVTPSRWDAYLGGDEKALTDEEKVGFTRFMETGCTACHAGAYVGGAMFQKLGLVKAWPTNKDLGRFEVTKNEADKMMFSVPSLRNIAKTGPYFHDGSVESLDEAVRMMAAHQLGKELADDDVKSIVAWLGSLTGEVPAAYIAKPELPASTDKTPKADPT
ncbi:cytochrome-c peroxidase [Vulgatibacter incomptus]|uniref:Cytochrome c551 peroxidase n=1 Tax=Vulgatibacter incomptus TaxID=1391653 RepID=A0A0K1PHY8_9BACT|nr:cytochrome c peroxidase [Vulgatibacter incomptus]AKU93158.1 Cytochrome c551 peroxidase [Vulgatibacter incomptus]